MTAPPQVAGIVLGRQLGRGGEATVYEMRDRPDLVAKIYHKPTVERAAKLAAMLARPPVDPGRGVGGQQALAWPREVVRSRAGNVIGFTMPRIDVDRATQLVNVFTPKRRRMQCPDFSWRYLLRTARNLAAVVAALHEAGYVIGDLSEVNTFVDLTAMVTVVDCDSFQVRDPATGHVYLNPVCRFDRTPPELQRHNLARLPRTHGADDFALAVLSFQLLLDGAHPFAGSFPGDPDPPPSIEQRIALGQYTRALPGIPPRYALPVSLLPPRLRELMAEAFVAGHADPTRRPSATTWAAALTEAEAELVDCRLSSTHVYSRHLRHCPWCERLRQTGADPFAPRGSGNATTTQVQSPLGRLTGFGQPGPGSHGPVTVPAQPTGTHSTASGASVSASQGVTRPRAAARLFAPHAVPGDSRGAASLRLKLPWLYGAGAGAVAAALPLRALVAGAAGVLLVVVANAVDVLRGKMPLPSGPSDWLLAPLRAAAALGQACRSGLVALGHGLLTLLLAVLGGAVLAALAVAGLLLSDRDLAPENNGEVFGALLGERLPAVALRLATAGIIGLLVARWLMWVDRCPQGTHRRVAPLLRRLGGAGEWGLVGQWLVVPAAAALLAMLMWASPWAPYGSAEETWATVTAPFRSDIPDSAGWPQAAGYAGLLTRAGTLTEASIGPMLAVRGACADLDSARRALSAGADERGELRKAALALPIDKINKGPMLRTALVRTLDAEQANERALAQWASTRKSTGCKPFADLPQAKAASTTLNQAQSARTMLAVAWNRLAGRYGLPSRKPSQV